MTGSRKKGFIDYKKKTLFFIFLFIAVWSISLLSYIFYYSFINKETGFSTLSYNYSKNIVANFTSGELLKDQKFSGEFLSHENNLGAISLRFNTFERANNDILEFKLKEKGAKDWYFVTKYNVKEFYELPLYPVGFPKIVDSKNKLYDFEILSTLGKNGKSIALSTADPILIAKHNFSKHEIFKNPLALFSYLIKKSSNFISSSNVLFLIIVFFISVVVLIKTRSEFGLYNKQLFFIVFVGMAVRIFLAGGPINFDLHSFSRYADIFRTTGFIYQFTYYNYPPFFYLLIGLLDLIRRFFSVIPLQFVLRTFLSLVDLATLFIIVEIAKQRKISVIKSCALFFLNPITISISGHHGQFDNIAILFLMTGFYFYGKRDINENLRQRIIWVFLALSLSVKQTVLFSIIQFWIQAFKNKTRSLIFLIGSFGVLGLGFLLFINNGIDNILDHVFKYGGLQGIYGVTFILKNISILFNLKNTVLLDIYKYIFIVSIFGFSFFIKQKDILRNSLLLFLFFLSFTSGIGVQYFMLPIALGVFFPTKWFYVYLITASLFFFGNSDEYWWPLFQFVSWDIVWISVILWFVSEVSFIFPKTKKVYAKIVNQLV